MIPAPAATPAATTAPGAPARNGARLLRGPTLAVMGRSVAVVIGAGVLAAVYQMMLDESRLALAAWRTRRILRRARHERVLLEALGSGLGPAVQERLLRSRDAFAAALALLADPALAACDRDRLRAVLRRIAGIDP